MFLVPSMLMIVGDHMFLQCPSPLRSLDDSVLHLLTFLFLSLIDGSANKSKASMEKNNIFFNVFICTFYYGIHVQIVFSIIKTVQNCFS